MDTTTSAQSPVPNEFVPDVGGTETTSASTMLVLAYLALWLILMVFVAANWRRQRALAERLSDVENALKSRAGSN
jgi:hypothetical protein